MTDFRVDYVDREGRPVPGLPVKGKAITVYQYDPAVMAAPSADAETGDLAMEYGDGVKGLRVRMDDGWHELGWLQIENHPPEHEEIRSMDTSVLRSWSGTQRVTVTVDGVNPEAVEMLTGLAAPRRWDQVHPRSRVRTPTARTPFWECLECGAETADEQLFAEAGCMPR